MTLPEKLLDSEEIEGLDWAPSFARVGTASRIDYTTNLHKGGRWTPFAHQFTSGVSIFAPGKQDDLCAEGMCRIRESLKPIWMGMVDRLYFVSPCGEDVVFVSVDLDVDHSGLNSAENFVVSEFYEDRILAWDPEGKQLLVVDPVDLRVEFVIRGGLLDLSEQAMIVG